MIFLLLMMSTADVPYFVHQKAFTHFANGSRRLDSQHTFARKSDGSIFEQSESFGTDGKRVNSGRHFALVGGLQVDTDDIAGLITAMHLPDGDKRRKDLQWTPESKCTKSIGGKTLDPGAKVSEEEFQGHHVFKIVTDLPGSRMVLWRARDLGCTVVKETLELRDPAGKAVDGWAEIVADKVRSGEPPAALFKMPAGLKNVSPSERIRNNRSNINKLVPVPFKEDDELYGRYKVLLP